MNLSELCEYLFVTYPHPYSITLPICFLPFLYIYTFPHCCLLLAFLSCSSPSQFSLSYLPLLTFSLTFAHPLSLSLSLFLLTGGWVDSAESCCDRVREGEWSLWHFSERRGHKAELLHLDVIPSDSSLWRAARRTGRQGGRHGVSLWHETELVHSQQRASIIIIITRYYTSHCISRSLLIVLLAITHLIITTK